MGYDSATRRMVSISSNSRRSMLLYGLVGIVWLVRTIESGPITESNESRQTLQSKKSQDEEVGNPSEIAYQAWLLIDGHPDGGQPLAGLDSASLLRRIKPKSIFVAPNLTACPEGYQDDTMNRCVKDVNIDHQAHKGFLVQRLQAIFGHKSSSSTSATGPLQLNIPLIIPAPVKPPRQTINFQLQTPQQTTTTTMSKTDLSSKISFDEDKVTNVDNIDKDGKQGAAIVTVYELNDDEATFFIGNKSSGNTVENNNNNNNKNRDPIAPVTDYKLPSIDNNDNRNDNLTILVSGSIDKDNKGTYMVKNDDDDDDNKTTVVLLLSPTKVPELIPMDIIANNSSLGQVIIKMENVTTTRNATKDIMRSSVPDESSSFDGINNDSAESSTIKLTNITTSGENAGHEPIESTEVYEIYDEKNYEDSTEDEILKHSEAGITVTQRVPDNSPTSYTDDDDDDDDKNLEGNSEITGDVSINRDFVRETTLVDLNLTKTKTNCTIVKSDTVQSDKPETLVAEEDIELPVQTHSDDLINFSKPDDDDDDNDDISIAKMNKLPLDDTSNKNENQTQKVVFSGSPIERTIENDEPTWTENSESTETMIASSTTNDARQTVVTREQPKFSIHSYGSSKKRAGQTFSFETTTKIPHKPFSIIPKIDTGYDYYPDENDSHEDGGVAVIRTINKHRYPSGAHKQYHHFFSSPQHRDYASLDSHGQPNYVSSFPSQQANSINPNDYKDRRPYNRYQHVSSSITKNPSTHNINDQQSYWWLPPGWPIDKQHGNQRFGNDRSRTPMLLRFWTRMPLVKDPSLNYQHPTYPTPPNRAFASTRTINYYKEMSTQDFNRAFMRKTLPSAIGG